MARTTIAVTPGTGASIDFDTQNSRDAQVIALRSSAAEDLVPATAADGLLVNLGSNNDVTVTGTVTVQDGGNTLTVDNGGTFAVQVDGAALTALQLIDDPVATLGTTTYTEATSKGFIIGAVRRDADTTLVDTTNEIAPLQVNAGGQLKVAVIAALPAGTNAIGKLAANSGVDIGDVDVTSVSGNVTVIQGTATSLKTQAEAYQGGSAVAAGNPLQVTLANGSVPSHAVTNAGTFVVQENGAALTALQLIDDIVYTDDTSTHATGSSKGALIMAAATPTDTSVNANDIGALAMTLARELLVSLTTALPAGTNAIGKLAANSGVDIGDVDVTSISAGSNLVGDVGIQPRTTNGLDTFMASGSDGSSILVATAQAVKASAGKVYGWFVYNPEAAVTFVHFYDTASGGVTVGTTSPKFTLQIPAGAAANVMSDIGITFGTAITIAATTTAGGNTAPATGASLEVFYK